MIIFDFIVLIAIMLLIDIIAIIVLIAGSILLTHADLGIPDNVLVDKRAAIAKQLKIWEISSVLPCKRDGWCTLGRPILPILMSMKL